MIDENVLFLFLDFKKGKVFVFGSQGFLFVLSAFVVQIVLNLEGGFLFPLGFPLSAGGLDEGLHPVCTEAFFS